MQLWRHQFRRTTLWLLSFMAVLAGLGLARSGLHIKPFLVMVCAIFVVLSLKNRKAVSLILVTIFSLGLGCWRGSIYMDKLAEYELLYDKRIMLRVVATEDATYGYSGQLAFNAKNLQLENGHKLTGKIQVSGFGTNAVFQDDEIVLTGKLRPSRGAYQGRMSYAQIQVLARHPTLVSEIRRRFVAGMQSALPEPQASFAMGLLVGQRANLPDEIKDDLQHVGLTHIIAVSGYNLTIIVQASRKLLGKRSKRISTFLMFSLISVFLLLAGFSAPIVRAAMVSMLSILAVYYGRGFKPLNLIFLAAAVTAWINPVYIWGDLSWYLSFLGFFGVMILSPLVQARWGGKWSSSLLGSVALESICAEMMTLPLILFVFGQMSRVGLIANVLVVTLIPLAMLLSTVAGLAGMILGSLSGWFAWPVILLLNYMLDIAHLLAGLPDVFIEGIGLSWPQMILPYAIINLIITILWYKNTAKSAIITDMTETKTGSLLA